MDGINGSHIAAPEVLHQRRYRSFPRRRDEEMDVVRHEYVCVHGAFAPRRKLRKQLQVVVAINVPKEASSTVHPALDDMDRDPRNIEAGWTRH